jgi:putative transcriptional regulator
MKADRILTPTTEQLEALFTLPSGPEREPGQLAGPQHETVAEPEAWVRDFLADLESPPIDTIDRATGRPLCAGEQEWARAEKQVAMLSAALPAAIRALRKKRGESQEEMGHKLGFVYGCVGRWESGRSLPSGVAILMLLRLCPDAETLANFGLAFSSPR